MPYSSSNDNSMSFSTNSSDQPEDGCSSSCSDDEYSQASSASSWVVQHQFDFPQLFPYHTGYNSVHAGGPTTTIGTPSIATSANRRSRNPRLQALGIQDLLEELHQKQLLVHRPPRRHLAPSLPLPSSATKEEQVKALQRLQNALALRRVDHFAGSSAALETELEVAGLKEQESQLALALGHSSLAVNALIERKRLLELVFGEDSPEVAHAALQLGHAQNNLGLYEPAHEQYQQACAIFETLKRDKEQAVCYIGMGRTLLNRGEFAQALPILTKGHNLMGKKQQEYGQVLQLLAIAEGESGGPMDEALGRLRIARKLYRAKHDTNNLLETMLTTAHLNASRGDYKMATRNLDDAQDMITDSAIMDRARIHCAKGDLYKLQRETLRAKECYLEALALCGRDAESSDSQVLAEVLVALGDLQCPQEEVALSFFQQVTTSDTSVLHRHVLLKRGILYFRSGEYGPACNDFQSYCLQQQMQQSPKDAAYRVALFSQGVCHYLVGGNNVKAKKLCKEALSRKYDAHGLDPAVQKTLKKCINKMGRIKLGKVLGRLIGTSGSRGLGTVADLGTVAE